MNEGWENHETDNPSRGLLPQNYWRDISDQNETRRVRPGMRRVLKRVYSSGFVHEGSE
jgi:hypothetical protein